MIFTLLILVLSLSLAPQAQDAKLSRIKELSRERGWSFLCYERLVNHVLYVDRGRVQQVFPQGSELFRTGHHARPSLSPDGSHIVFVRPVSITEADETIVVHDLERNQATELLTWPSRVWGLAWSPDGAEVAFVADQNSQTGLFTVRLADRSVTQWPSEREVSTDAAPSWSPDGNAIAVQRDVGLGAEIVIIERRADSARRLAPGRFPAWSPKGDRIAFLDLQGKRCLTIKPDGTEMKDIFSPFQFTQQLTSGIVWSPESRHLIFHRTHGMKGDFRVIFLYERQPDERRRIYTGESLEITGWVKSR